MNKKILLLALLLTVIFLLAGCNMRTIDELYCLPERSQSYTNIQSQIDKMMQGLDYCAPVSGENRQTVQMSDLDGDGKVEYIVFAKGNSEKPLKILIFSSFNDVYTLVDMIESTGTAFEQVEYVQMNHSGGYELVIGRQVSDQVVRSVSVYSMDAGNIEHLVTANYSKFVCADLDGDRISELLVLRPGQAGTINGVAERYSLNGQTVERSIEVNLSEPAESIKRIIISNLNDGIPAVFVTSASGSDAVVTDVISLISGQLQNVTVANESDTGVQTLQNYYVFADDLDDDGILELPHLVPMIMPGDIQSAENQQLIQWYTMDSAGVQTDKVCTYHNFVGGWYLHLETAVPERIVVVQQGNTFMFSIWNEDYSVAEKLMTMYVLTGQNREEQALVNNRIVVHRTESAVYAVDLEPTTANHNITKESLINSFHLILDDWKTGES